MGCGAGTSLESFQSIFARQSDPARLNPTPPLGPHASQACEWAYLQAQEGTASGRSLKGTPRSRSSEGSHKRWRGSRRERRTHSAALEPLDERWMYSIYRRTSYTPVPVLCPRWLSPDFVWGSPRSGKQIRRDERHQLKRIARRAPRWFACWFFWGRLMHMDPHTSTPDARISPVTSLAAAGNKRKKTVPKSLNTRKNGSWSSPRNDTRGRPKYDTPSNASKRQLIHRAMPSPPALGHSCDPGSHRASLSRISGNWRRK